MSRHNNTTRANKQAKSTADTQLDDCLYVFRFTKAVQESRIDKRYKCLLLNMALKADGHTGVGIHSQKTIGDAMGYCAKYVQDLMAEMDADTTVPFRIIRTRRSNNVGHRTTDRYELVMVDVANEEPNGTQSSVGAYRNEMGGLTEREGGPNGTPCSEDQISNQISNQIFLEKSSKSSKGASEETTKLKEFYCAEFSKHQGNGKPPSWGKLTAKAMSAFAELVGKHGLEDAKTIVTNALSRQTNWCIEPWQILQGSNNYLVAKLDPKKGRTPVQSTGVDVFAGVREVA